MDLNWFKAEMRKATMGDPTADAEVVEFWKDLRQTYGIPAATAHPKGIAPLVPDSGGNGVIEWLPISWGILDDEWAAWIGDDDPSPAA